MLKATCILNTAEQVGDLTSHRFIYALNGPLARSEKWKITQTGVSRCSHSKKGKAMCHL